MSSYHFASAGPDESTVFGACRPSPTSEAVNEWIAFMRERGIRRVCCLLTSDQMADYPLDLIHYYRHEFGSEDVLYAPIDDYHLAPRSTLDEKIIPFLRDSDEKSLPVVVHCWSGNGRTGHILAAWLVRARGMAAAQAIKVVEQSGRKPTEAVRAENATESELHSLLSGSA